MHSQTLCTRFSLARCLSFKFCADSTLLLLLREWRHQQIHRRDQGVQRPPPPPPPPPPPSVSVSFSFFTPCVMQEVFKQAGCSSAAFETAYLIAAGWLVGLDSAAGTGAPGTSARSDAQVFLSHDNTHTHTHAHTHYTYFPILISINHWPFCKCCWLPIINDYALLATGKVRRVKTSPSHWTLFSRRLHANSNEKNCRHIFIIMSICREMCHQQ